MRIFTAVASIIMALVLYDFSNKASLAGSFANRDDLSNIAGAAILGALLWVLGGALVYFYPRTSIILFILSFVVMAPAQLGSVETDMLIYMWFGPVFALTAFLGWRGKKKADAEKQEEKDRQYRRDAMLEQMMRQHSSPSAPSAPGQVWKTSDPQTHTDRPGWMGK